MRRLILLALCVLLAALASPRGAVQAQGQVATITAAALNVRGGPGTGYGVLGVARRGESLPVVGQSGGWVQVEWRQKRGWVSAAFVRLSSGGGSPTAASGGGKIVFALHPGGTLYTVSGDGSNLRSVGAGLDPAWSPDGSRIAYADWNEPRGIYLMNADGSGKTRIFDGSLVKAPAWSPDGSRIAFNQQKGGQLEDQEVCYFGYCFTSTKDPYWWIGIVELASGQFREPQSDGHSFSPVWRSSSEILFDSREGLGVAYANSDQLSSTLVKESRLYDPRLCTPTGKIAATFYQHDHWELYTLAGNGGALTRLTGSESIMNRRIVNNVAPAWSPDCSQLLFLSDRDGRWRPYIMNADGSNQRPFLPATFDGLAFEYGFSSDRVFDWTR